MDSEPNNETFDLGDHLLEAESIEQKALEKSQTEYLLKRVVILQAKILYLENKSR